MTLDRDEVDRLGLLEGAITMDDRLALLELLAAEGVTLPEMAEAHRHGGLLRIAGERVVRPGTGSLSLADVAARHGVGVELVQRIMRTLGAIDPGPDARASSEDDVELVSTALLLLDQFGDEMVWSLLRRVGAAVERVTEAMATAVILEWPDISVARSGSEETTARAWGKATALVPKLGHMLDLVLRHHVEGARRYLEDAGAGEGTPSSFQLAVGFADLSGYTSASLRLDLQELGAVIAAFEARATDIVTAHGGRVIKFVGDAVLWVCSDLDAHVDIARSIVEPADATGPRLQARAGLSHGWVLARDGDYFGPTVNLAARLVDITPPGRVTVADELGALLDRSRWALERQDPAQVRGIDEPVISFLLAP